MSFYAGHATNFFLPPCPVQASPEQVFGGGVEVETLSCGRPDRTGSGSRMQCWNRGASRLLAAPLARWSWARHSSTKLFVGGLCYDTNETVLKDAFGQHGEIIEAKVICDHKSGESKGYGFVRFTSEAAATAALKEMDGQVLDSRSIRVYYAHKQ